MPYDVMPGDTRRHQYLSPEMMMTALMTSSRKTKDRKHRTVLSYGPNVKALEDLQTEVKQGHRTLHLNFVGVHATAYSIYIHIDGTVYAQNVQRRIAFESQQPEASRQPL
jgi:hypothetical protein